MAGLSNLIEQFIKELIDEMDGVVEIQRNELASQLCPEHKVYPI